MTAVLQTSSVGLKDPVRSPYSSLLQYPDFRRWIRNVERGSVVSGYEMLRRLGYVGRRFGKSPQDFAKMSVKAATDFLLDMVDELEKEGRSGSYIANLVKAVKSWLDFNDIQVVKKIRIKGRGQLTRLADEKPPSPEEFRRILNAADLRAKTACAIVGFAGQRLEVLGDYLGRDGLKLKDLPELSVKGKKAKFQRMPTRILVRPELSKNNHQYLSFLCDEGCEYLKEYLEWRVARGEKLTPDSPVITPVQSPLAGKHIRTTNIGDLMKKPIRTANLDSRPYNLRRYFLTRLMMAEADGLIIRDYRLFWAGHTGDIQHTYTVNKGLTEDVVEKMRSAYEKAADKYLATRQRETPSQDTMVATFNRQFLAMAGYGEDEISKMGDLSKLAPQQIQEFIQKKSMMSLGLNGNSRQKIVPFSEVRNRVVEGWEFVQLLPNGEAVVKLP